MEAVNQRIQTLINTLGESNNRFAQRIDTSSAVISHILTGRNRPNLELVQKILKAFPNLRANWLVMGEGPMHYDSEQSLLSEPKVQSANPSDAGASTQKATTEAPATNSQGLGGSYESNGTMPPLLKNILQSQRMMLRNMEQQVQMQEAILDWMIDQGNHS